MEITISKSKNPKKKYDAKVNGKTISFGASGYSDFTQRKDKDRKRRYINRHKKNEDWANPMTAGFYAKAILWNKDTVKASFVDINKRVKRIHLKLK